MSSKDVTGSVWKYEQNKCHKDAVQVMVVLPKTTPNVGEMLSIICVKVMGDSLHQEIFASTETSVSQQRKQL